MTDTTAALPWTAELAGRFDHHWIDAEHLRGNPLGDPTRRPLRVYLPPGYDRDDRRYPTVYVIQGYTGYLSLWDNRTAFRRPYPELVDQVFADGSVPPCLVVLVDTWTSYGGSQFVDSIGTGNYHSYLCEDIVSWVDAHYRTIDAPASRAITGKSSGGYGAMITPMLRPDLFGALATHAGDSLFEVSYGAEFGPAARALRNHDSDITRWWADFRQGVPFTRPYDGTLLELYGVGACYSPAEDGRSQLPFDQRTGAIVPAVWERWLEHDPVRMVPRRVDAVRSLHSVWIDAGDQDDYYLDLGAQEFAARLQQAGVPDEAVHFELFAGTHAAIEYRYPLALRWLADRLSRDGA